MRRNPTIVGLTPLPIAFLLIDVGQVETEAATIMDRELDNGDGGGAGTIQFTTAEIAAQVLASENKTAAIPATIPGSGMVNLTYRIPINGSAC